MADGTNDLMMEEKDLRSDQLVRSPAASRTGSFFSPSSTEWVGFFDRCLVPVAVFWVPHRAQKVGEGGKRAAAKKG